MKTVRCVRCRSEFTDEEIADASACPYCKSPGAPMAIANDATIKINTHELRILTFWARYYAEQCDRNDPDNATAVAAIEGILSGLQPQVNVPLSLKEELKDVARVTGSPIEVRTGGRRTIVKPPEKN